MNIRAYSWLKNTMFCTRIPIQADAFPFLTTPLFSTSFDTVMSLPVYVYKIPPGIVNPHYFVVFSLSYFS